MGLKPRASTPPAALADDVTMTNRLLVPPICWRIERVGRTFVSTSWWPHGVGKTEHALKRFASAADRDHYFESAIAEKAGEGYAIDKSRAPAEGVVCFVHPDGRYCYIATPWMHLVAVKGQAGSPISEESSSEYEDYDSYYYAGAKAGRKLSSEGFAKKTPPKLQTILNGRYSARTKQAHSQTEIAGDLTISENREFYGPLVVKGSLTIEAGAIVVVHGDATIGRSLMFESASLQVRGSLRVGRVAYLLMDTETLSSSAISADVEVGKEFSCRGLHTECMLAVPTIVSEVIYAPGGDYLVRAGDVKADLFVSDIGDRLEAIRKNIRHDVRLCEEQGDALLGEILISGLADSDSDSLRDLFAAIEAGQPVLR